MLVFTACSESTGSVTTQPPPTTIATESTAPTAAGGGNAAAGEALYGGSCVACHGPAGEGVPSLGLPFVESDFVSSRTDAELADFIAVGRAVDDPANTTGVPMLPRGGNPSLSDEDLLDIAAFIRTLSG
jgi:disulfide bond formation protein DsbB